MEQGAGGVRYLTKEEFFEKASLPEEDFELPSGNGTIRIRGLTADETLSIMRGAVNEDAEISGRMKRYILAGTIEPVFSVADLEMLGASSAVDVIGIANRIMELSGIIGDASDFLTKTPNTNSTPSSVSSTLEDSPANSQPDSPLEI